MFFSSQPGNKFARQLERIDSRLRTITKLPLSAITTTAIAFLVYLLTLEPDLTWANFGGDGGELITAAVTFGVPHPPGYPTYVLIGNLFGRLPLGTIAYRFNLLSAVATAVSAGLVSHIVYQLRTTDDRWAIIPAISAGLSLAFAPLVWSQAIIAEVYALNLVFVAAFLYFLIRRSNCQFDPRSITITGLLFGLSITTHLTSIFLLPLALILIPTRRWTRLVAGILVGLLPFLALPLLAQSGSPVIWGRPDIFQGWWWLVSAQLYRPNVFGLPPAEWPARLGHWVLPFLQQFAYIGFPLLFLGIIGRLKTHSRLLAGLSISAFFYAVYTFTYNTFDAAVLILPALLLLSVILGFGLQHLGKAAIVLPLALLWLNLSQPEIGYYVNQAQPVRPEAEALLDSVPPDSILLTPGDPTIFALWYFHHVEGKWPDAIIIDGNLFQFDWYREQLGRDFLTLQHLVQDDLPGFIEKNRQLRPLCEVSLATPGYLQC